MATDNPSGHDFDHDAILERSANLTWELTSRIIDHFIGTPALRIGSDSDGALTSLKYEAEIGPFTPSSIFGPEHEWLVRRKWLRHMRTFYDAMDFVLLHVACMTQLDHFSIEPRLLALVSRLEKFPRIMRFSPELNLTGLENIELALPTDVFFTIFGVTVPPFPTDDTQFYREEHYGAGKLLVYTRSLTLRFSTSDESSNPWYLLVRGPWSEADADADDARPVDRGNVCSAGLIVDWILTYAWHHEYLQHIPHITLEGDIQDWVKVKWDKIFKRAHPEQNYVASLERIRQIEHRGVEEADDAGIEWTPTEHYPPTCQCSIKCNRLSDGVTQTEFPAATQDWLEEEWRYDSQEDSSSPESQDWFNSDGGEWAD